MKSTIPILLIGACFAVAAQDPIAFTIGPGKETTVTVPNVKKDNVSGLIASMLMDDPALRKRFDALLGTANELTLVITTKRSATTNNIGKPKGGWSVMMIGDTPHLTWTNALPVLNETYTVTVADVWKHTNCVEVRWCSEFCTLVKYVDDGVTNDFHAAFAPVKVETNSVTKH